MLGMYWMPRFSTHGAGLSFGSAMLLKSYGRLIQSSSLLRKASQRGCDSSIT
jgi:hypothetical protein